MAEKKDAIAMFKSKITGKDYDDEKKVSKVENWFTQAKNSRTNREYQWMINYLSYRGHYDVQYSQKRNRLEKNPTDTLGFSINFIYPMVRAVKANVLRYKPLGVVSPEVDEPWAMQFSKMQSLYLAKKHDALNMSQKLREALQYALLYSTGVFEYGWDSEAADGEGDFFVDVHDPFDIYVDPVSIDPYARDARYIIKAKKVSIDYIKSNPAYPKEKRDKVKPESDIASSQYKSYMMRFIEEWDESSTSNDSVILYECWYMPEKLGIDKSQKEEGNSSRINVMTVAGGVVLRDEETDYDEFPFVIFTIEDGVIPFGGDGWVKNVVPVARMLNYLYRSGANFHLIMSRGKYLVRKGDRPDVINTKSGQILEFSDPGSVQQMQMAGLPASMISLQDTLYTFMEDIGAFHAASRGQVPERVSSGAAIEALQMGDVQNLSDIRDHLESALSVLYQKAFFGLPAKKYATARSVTVPGEGGSQSLFYVCGSETTLGKKVKASFDVDLVDPETGETMKAPEGGDVINGVPLIALPSDVSVDVKIGSELGHTPEARQERLAALFQQGLISKKTYLNAFDIDYDAEKQRIDEENPPPPPGPMPQESTMPEAVEGGTPQIPPELMMQIQGGGAPMMPPPEMMA